MFFYASKPIFFLLTPSNFLVLMASAGCILLATGRLRRAGLFLATGGLLGLLAAGLLPVSALALLPLEERFPAFVEDGRRVHGVIVLGGALDAVVTKARGGAAVNDAGERLIGLVQLSRRYPDARLLVSGGDGSLTEGGGPEAVLIGDLAGTLGVSRERLILEARSRNTRENAAFSAEAVRPQPGERWLLVTSAWHMPRAMGCFRRVGFDVAAYPVDYRTAGLWSLARPFSSAAVGLAELDMAVKEWIGLVAYRLAGYTDQFLPEP